MTTALRSLGAKVVHRQWVHQSVPVPLSRAIVAARARRAWEQPTLREQAIKQMRFLLGRSSRADEVEALAPAYIEQTFLRGEFRWRPGMTTRHRFERLDRIHEAAAEGRGVIVNYLHQGVLGIPASLGRAGLPVHTPVWDGLFDAAAPSQRQWLKVISTYATTFRAAGSFPYMLELLTAGNMVVMSYDMPGNLPMTFLGRRVGVASGTARLALESGAPVVPITTHRAGIKQLLRVHEPIDSRGFADPGAVQAEIARLHEKAVLAWPQAVENPLRRWNPLDPEDVAEFGLSREARDRLLL